MKEEILKQSISRRALLAGTAGAVGLAALDIAQAPPAAAWGGYSNGQIPLSAMTRIEYPGVNYWTPGDMYAGGSVGGVYMEPTAATHVMDMLWAHQNEMGTFLPLNEGYRNLIAQQYWYDKQDGSAEVGGSNHGFGLAIDFDGWEGSGRFTQSQYNWMIANCGRFGFAPLQGPWGQFDYIHFNYTGQITPQGEPMPTVVETTRSVPIALTAMTEAQAAGPAWPLIPYLDSSSTATNIAETSNSSFTLFDAIVNLYITGLPAGEFVNARLAVQARSNNAISGAASTMVVGNNLGTVRGLHAARIKINQSTHRLVLQAYSSVPGVTLSLWRFTALAW